MLHQKPEFLTGFRSVEYGTVQNLNSKCLRDTYSGWMVSARMQRNIDDVCDSNAVEAIWSILWREHDFYVKGLQLPKLWEMIVHRLKFKTCKMLEVYWIFVGFNTIFMGSVFLCHPVFIIS